MIKRIKSLISVKNLTASQFADLLGVQRSNISHIISGRNKPSLDFILKIIETFPTVSTEWLINGKGEMFTGTEKPKINSQLEILTPNNEQKMEENLVKNEEEEKLEKINQPSVEKEPIYTRTADVKEDAQVPINQTIENLHAQDIEQIMILYKNGSFKAYKPQK